MTADSIVPYSIIPYITIGGFLLALLLICWCVKTSDDRKAENVAQIKIEELEREVERLKGFPLVKVKDVEIGQIVSNADSVYLCISYIDINHEVKFLDLINKEFVCIPYRQQVRKRDDLDLELSKMIGVQNDKTGNH